MVGQTDDPPRQGTGASESGGRGSPVAFLLAVKSSGSAKLKVGSGAVAGKVRAGMTQGLSG